MFSRRTQHRSQSDRRRWMNRSALALLSVTALVLTASRAFIVDGTPTAKGGAPQVFALLHETHGLTRICSATLIHPRLLLTAAHCIPETSELTGLSVTDSTNVHRPEWGSGSFKPVAFGRHPRYDDATLNDLQRTAYDVGFVVVDRPAAAAPHALFSADSKWDRQLIAKQILTLYGYGESTRDESLWGTTSGTKRFGLVKPKSFARDLFSIEAGPQNIAPGDSGGPALMRLNGVSYVVGVASGSPVLADPERMTPMSVFSLVRRETICWVQNSSGIDLGYFCPLN